ncbi:DNA-processing protein DprA [Falsirhodobacter xinxiangensis]|uniref:DNA-processing protein DprA n=1 Tax=Falsirhodobacter xinxiangensis TaxID=2530049 RepID=UPI0010AACEF9|nr:DNA-processing protein DprA [Rhodobacter xinxiangensis]
MEQNALNMLRLIRSRRVGAVTFHRLLAEHGGAAAALDALPGIARAAGVSGYEACPEGVARAEIAKGHAAGARLLCFGDADYPGSLADLPDAPAVLWAIGDVSLLSQPMVALVGARNASSLGIRMARKLAWSLGEAGHVVVSGLARGIDAEAHEAALDSGTVAVLGGGVDVVYPQENAGLHARIAEKGCLLSEQPPGTEPQARHFPLRNRIVSGISRAVVVVEAAARSGSLITARNALDQGRDVFAVPGHPFDARAAGCNLLIREGAILVRSAADVIEGTGHVQRPLPLEQPAPKVDPGPLDGRILSLLGPSPVAEDQLIRDLGLPAETLATALLSLELDGVIERQAGGLLARVG